MTRNGFELLPADDGDAYLLWRSTSPSMQPIEVAIPRIAHTNIPVLLIGESGTGKEAIARQIHRLSTRSSEPLVKAICVSSAAELFARYFNPKGNLAGNGHANPGTLFLKEISELDPGSQRALLYSLPEADVSDQSVSVPRVISSTIRNLKEEIRAGRFRTELYYRIDGVCLHLPPLRERKEDIPALVDLFLTKYSSLLCQPRPRLDSEDLSLLREHSWPGNIRELENVLRKIVALRESKTVLFELLELPAESRSAHPVGNGSALKAATRAATRRTERKLILEALNRTHWNRKRAAQELQISYKSLLYKLKEIGAEEGDPV
jgi:two-component system, NtrC family, response regulator AtoC